MKSKTLFGIGAALMLAVGCRIDERLEWAPDGSRAALRVGDALRLVDTNGNLSAPLVSNIVAAVWLPDSRGLIVLRDLTVTNWAEAVRLLPAEETAAAKTLAKSLPDLFKAALTAADGDWAAVEKKFSQPLKIQFSEVISLAVLSLLDTQPAALRQAVDGFKDAGKLEANLSGLSTTRVSEVSVLLLTGETRAIEHTLAGLQQPRPSPSAPVVAFLRDETLTVAPLDGSTNRVVVADRVAGRYDWTPDGKSLVYAVRLTEREASDIYVTRIERRTVIDAAGALAAGEVQPLALNGSTFEPGVRCLTDGRVLFAGVALQLPSPATAAQASRFYLIDPARGTNTVPMAIATAAGSLPQDLSNFVPSRDGRQIAVVDSDTDAVTVVDVATGVLQVISPKRGWKSRILPAWRGADELYFAALPESSSPRPELWRWRKGGAPQVISTNWPDAAVTGLLEKPSK